MCQILLLHSEVRSTCPLVCDCHVLCALCCLKVFVSQTPDVDHLSITQVRTYYLDTCAGAVTWKSILKRSFMYLKERERGESDWFSICWLTEQMPATGRAEPGQSRESGAPLGSAPWVTGALTCHLLGCMLAGVRPGLRSRHSDVKCRHLKWCLERQRKIFQVLLDVEQPGHDLASIWDSTAWRRENSQLSHYTVVALLPPSDDLPIAPDAYP